MPIYVADGNVHATGERSTIRVVGFML